ncbi:MFS transporter [Brucella gallinifaecis]|uniref:MFS transporter n=1 Tax=Brucella gallinifaecis TaxID=215590 RepID=A0A502BSI6_9HYPH|nr:MFS transporter [Brucella gallinifaecis]TPF76807.1 MFS transporter [Brucella gallinifaecis]
MELRHIRYVVAAARNGSFSAAAHELHVRQPIISRRIKELEDELGISLFDRSSSGARLTPCGEEFIVDARRIIEDIQRLTQRAKASKAGKLGRVVVGFYKSLSTGHLRTSLHEFRQSGFVAGLILGGVITDLMGWRWVLWINVPIGVLVVAFAGVLPVGKPGAEAVSGKLDVLGAMLVATGAASLVYAFANSEHVGLAHPTTFGLILLALALLGMFVWVESKVDTPLMPIPVFWRRSTGGANLVSLLANTALGPTFVIVALYMQETLGFTATQTGLGLLPMATAFTLASALVGPALIAKVGTKPVVLDGMILFIAGLATLGVSLSADASWAASILPGTVVAGIGYGIAFPAWTVAGIEGVEAADHGLAGGMLTTTQEVGSAVGLAVGVAVSVAVLASGGTAAQGASSAILVSACIVLVGLISAAIILPRNARERPVAR